MADASVSLQQKQAMGWSHKIIPEIAVLKARLSLLQLRSYKWPARF